MFNILLYSSSSPLIQPQPQVPAALWLLMARDERRGTENPLIMTSVALLLHCCVQAAHYGAYSRPAASHGWHKLQFAAYKRLLSQSKFVRKLFSAATKVSQMEKEERKKHESVLFLQMDTRLKSADGSSHSLQIELELPLWFISICSGVCVPIHKSC